jgi:glycosyltransferase A (GT-A) superfamily protein (DUF2064 family)
MTARLLVVAKSPVPGRVKTRLGAVVGMDRAAELAAAALLDTVRTCVSVFGEDRCRLALEGNLGDSPYAATLGDALDGWAVFAQVGDGLAERLANAHLALVTEGDGPVVQIGMDTPQVTSADLTEVLSGLAAHPTVLADAEDGGWWALGLSDPHSAKHLVGVPMSQPSTGALTRAALESAGLSVGRGPVLRDVDTVEDAHAVAEVCGQDSAFAAAWGGSRG